MPKLFDGFAFSWRRVLSPNLKPLFSLALDGDPWRRLPRWPWAIAPDLSMVKQVPQSALNRKDQRHHERL